VESFCSNPAKFEALALSMVGSVSLCVIKPYMMVAFSVAQQEFF